MYDSGDFCFHLWMLIFWIKSIISLHVFEGLLLGAGVQIWFFIESYCSPVKPCLNRAEAEGVLRWSPANTPPNYIFCTKKIYKFKPLSTQNRKRSLNKQLWDAASSTLWCNTPPPFSLTTTTPSLLHPTRILFYFVLRICSALYFMMVCVVY